MIQFLLILLTSTLWASNKPPLGAKRVRYRTLCLYTIHEAREYQRLLALKEKAKSFKKKRDDEKTPSKRPYFVPPLNLTRIPGYTPIS